MCYSLLQYRSIYLFADESDFFRRPLSIAHGSSSIFPACDVFCFRDGSRGFAEVWQCDRIVNEQIHSLKVRGLLDHLL